MEGLPYTVEVREDTGLYNGKLGIWLFLASEVMLFGALFSTYVIMRIGSQDWPMGAEYLSIPIGAFNTIVLILSSITIIFSYIALKEKNFEKYRMYMGWTILLACAFLFVKLTFEYAHKFEHHHYPSSSTFFAIYFTLTGLHGLHVLGGIIVNSYFWGPGAKMWETDPERFTNRIEIAGLYWHFVDLVWIFLFPVLYLL